MPPKMLRMVPLGLRHIFFKLNSVNHTTINDLTGPDVLNKKSDWLFIKHLKNTLTNKLCSFQLLKLIANCEDHKFPSSLFC